MTYTSTSMTMEQVQELIRNERAMQEGNIRDRFAMNCPIDYDKFASALKTHSSYSMEPRQIMGLYCTLAYEYADAMIQKRG